MAEYLAYPFATKSYVKMNEDQTSLIKSLFCILVFSLFHAGLAAVLLAQTEPPSVDKKPIVIVVTIDGFPARALEDPRLPMPTLRSLAASGAVAAGMQPINPTVTWPNHTAMVTGVNSSQHFVMANGLIVLPPDGTAPTVKPWIDKDKLVHARTLYEAAAEKGLTTGQVDWVAIFGAKGVNWQFGESPDLRDAIPQELIARGEVTRQQLETFIQKSSSAWRDLIWTDAAVDIIEKHTPNLLLFHLLQTDSIQHQYGPLTPPAYAAYAYADHCLERVVDAARNAGILDRTTFFILSDHGFATYTHTISPNVALVQQGLLSKENDSYRGERLDQGGRRRCLALHSRCEPTHGVVAEVEDLLRQHPRHRARIHQCRGSVSGTSSGSRYRSGSAVIFHGGCRLCLQRR